MREADGLTGILSRAPALRTDADPPWGNDGEDAANREPPDPMDDWSDDPDTLLWQNRGPARGIVLALVPAVLVWAVLIALVRALL